MKLRLTAAILCTLLAAAPGQEPASTQAAPAAPASAPAAPTTAPEVAPILPETDPFAQTEAELIGSIVQQKIAAAMLNWRMLGYGKCGARTLAVIGTSANSPALGTSTDGAAPTSVSPQQLVRTVVWAGLSLSIDLGKGQAATVTITDLSPTGVTLRTESGQKIILH